MNHGCEFHADALIERATGRLEDERAARLDAHLDACPECQDTLRTIHALRASALEVPLALEARIQAAVRDASGVSVPPVTAVADGAAHLPRHARVRWRRWTLPLAAAAAAVGIWIGVGAHGTGPTDVGGTALAALAAMDDYDPYGGWPAEEVIVAGDPLLSELSVEELEALLVELGS